MANEGEFPKIDGDVLFASEVNSMVRNPIAQIYTDTGFDSTVSGAASSDEQSFELDAVAANEASTAENVKIKILGTIIIGKTTGSGRESRVELKAQIKETSGVYADIVPYAIVQKLETGVINDENFTSTSSYTFEIVSALTSGMKTNGFQIKVFSQSTNDLNASSSFTNIQTVQELA